MTKRIFYKFKDPNNDGEFIDFWTYNQDRQRNIIFNNNVRLDSSCLTNISNLVNRIRDNNNTFWNEVTINNPGYVPTGDSYKFLYMNSRGEAEWVQPQYYRTNWNPEVQLIKVNNVGTNSVLTQINENSTDFLLDLSNFLLEVNINLNPSHSLENLSVEDQ